MKEIRYRAKTLKGNSWVYGYPEKFNNCMSPATAIMHYFSDWSLNMSLDIDPETIGQFVGLSDKNNTQMYEGDIVRVHLEYKSGSSYLGDDEDFSIDCYAVVTMDPRRGSIGKVFKTVNLMDDSVPDKKSTVALAKYRTEVIGNIFDNKDLLEVK